MLTANGISLGARLKYLRLAAGMSQAQLAKKLNYAHPVTIGATERGQWKSLNRLVRIADALDCDITMKITPRNRPKRLDVRHINLAGRFSRRPRLKIGDEALKMAELLAKLSPSQRPQRRRYMRNRATSERKNYSAKAAMDRRLLAKQNEQPEPSS